MGAHKDSTGSNVHTPFSFVYADSTARLAAAGFGADDVNKIALQLDDASVWILTDDSPITWSEVGGSATVAVLDDIGDVNASSPGDGDVLTWDDGGNEWIPTAPAGGADIEPWLVDILPQISTPLASTGTWATGYWTGEGQNGPWRSGEASGLQNTSNAQNDAISWDIALSAGTWTATFWVRKSTNTGIITLNVDGSSVGTVDTYNGSILYVKVSITGISIATSGKHTVEIKMATKNASSSAYNLGLFSISLNRTA